MAGENNKKGKKGSMEVEKGDGERRWVKEKKERRKDPEKKEEDPRRSLKRRRQGDGLRKEVKKLKLII